MLVKASYSVWGVEYIVYFILTIILTIGGLILINKYVKKEKTISIITKVTAGCLLVVVIANRISVCVYNIYTLGDTTYSWWNLVPNTFCGLSSFILGIITLFIKPKNVLFHFFVYMSVGGPIITSFYPDFIARQGFWEAASFTGILHHSIALFLSLTLLVTKRFNPEMRKFYIYPIAYALCIAFGVFEIQVFGIPDAMQIKNPLLGSFPILTSWWMLGIISCVIVFVSILLYLHFREHKTYKEIILSLKPASSLDEIE